MAAGSKTQIDKLGERLKAGRLLENDLRELDEYRRSFNLAYDEILATLRDGLGLRPTGRRTKSTPSVIDKLRRESVRLTQMQDVTGCRLVVDDIVAQDTMVKVLTQSFTIMSVVDRRRDPSHGYRAVHVIAAVRGRPVEIQVRTRLQHLWSQASELYSDRVNPAIKYGAAPRTFASTWLASPN